MSHTAIQKGVSTEQGKKSKTKKGNNDFKKILYSLSAPFITSEQPAELGREELYEKPSPASLRHLVLMRGFPKLCSTDKKQR